VVKAIVDVVLVEDFTLVCVVEIALSDVGNGEEDFCDVFSEDALVVSAVDCLDAIIEDNLDDWVCVDAVELNVDDKAGEDSKGV